MYNKIEVFKAVTNKFSQIIVRKTPDSKEREELNLSKQEMSDVNVLIHSTINQWQKNENAH
jgi:hypothetical protein